MSPNHQYIRQKVKWGTYGKSGNEPLKHLNLFEIDDDHLENIIPFIEARMNFYGDDILAIMKDEVEYRKLNNIHIPFKFGK